MPVTANGLWRRYSPRMTHPYSRRSFLQTTAAAGAAFAGVPHFSHVLSARSGDFPTAAPAAKEAATFPGPTPLPKPAYPVTDYHVHLSPTLTIDQALALGKERGVQIGIVDHPGPGFPINTDAEFRAYIDNLRKYPVHIGLQPVYPGWSKAFSKPLLDELDYILMDALTIPKPDGTYLAIWAIDTMVDDADTFMTRYMQFIEQLLTTEPIDIFGWPTFLPVPIAREYSRVWTTQRIDRIIDLCANPPKGARAQKIAVEINELAHIPDENFINRAKKAGLKFTFGTDSRNQNATHFSYCYHMAQKCGLTESDMLVLNKK